jgi:hypothetical protein
VTRWALEAFRASESIVVWVPVRDPPPFVLPALDSELYLGMFPCCEDTLDSNTALSEGFTS